VPISLKRTEAAKEGVLGWRGPVAGKCKAARCAASEKHKVYGSGFRDKDMPVISS